MLPLSSGAAVISSTNNNNEPPPPPNPILTAYESWYHNTPFVTRFILSIQAISYITSWFFTDPNFALANIPLFILAPHYEIYRLITSPYLVNTSLLSLILSFLSFNEQGKRLEYSLGSTRFVVLCFCIGIITNITFLLLSIIMFYSSGGGPDQTHILLSSASGIWLVLFGIIAMECVQAPIGTQRKLFLFQIPVLYYPIALFLFFTFLSVSFSLGYCISIALGYLYGFGHLDRIQLSHGKATEWEDGGGSNGLAAALTRRDGWVSCHAATGSDAWIESASTIGGSGGGSASGGGGMTMPLFRTPGTSNISSLAGTATGASAPLGASRPGSVFRTGSSGGGAGAGGGSSFAASSMSAGRTLGRGGTGESTTINGVAASTSTTTTRRPGHTTADARAARLQALEQRRSHYPDGGGGGGGGGGSSGGNGTQQQQSTTGP